MKAGSAELEALGFERIETKSGEVEYTAKFGSFWVIIERDHKLSHDLTRVFYIEPSQYGFIDETETQTVSEIFDMIRQAAVTVSERD